ncbi:AraC family transcriptional regulator [Ruminococcaceae bacterium OttesenSCG-928-O06]|nr:AraC family transcriptional regulator [Ruminococcaceae bacterium OttesenSCG-928-O06]
MWMAGAMLLRRDDYEGGTTRDEAAGQIPSAAREVYEMMCVTEGSAEYWVEDQHYKLAAGDVLLIPVGAMVGATLKARGCPFERHGLWMSRRYMTFLRLQDEEADYCFAKAEAEHRYLLRLPPDVFEGIRLAFETLAEECQNDRFNAELSTKAILAALCVQLNRLIQGQGDDVFLAGDGNRLAPVLSHIHQNCTAPISVEGLAERFNYSPSHLAHSFKKQMGTSLYHYVLLRRLQIGREAMLQGVPVKEAYQKCGFGDYAGFYRAFVKEFGLSPQQYKKKNQ